jgi:formylmethanofuran dehydrogenase subunit B
LVTHPRHWERYSAEPKSDWLPGGRKDRVIVVVDGSPHETADAADFFVPVKPERDFEAIWTLRQLIRGESPSPGVETGAELADLRKLAELMVTCRFGAVFFGLGLARTTLGYLNVEALLKLVAELNDQTRFTARRLRVPGNVSGADSVLCWQTGYPFGVNLGRGYPRYNPGEFTAGELLERREVDACLLVGSQDVSELSALAREHLDRIPVITLDPAHQPTQINASVRFTTAVAGVHHAGTVYRMDETPLPLASLIPTESPSDQAILSRILQKVRPWVVNPSKGEID